ncbi:MAG: hypothetical protein IPK16_10540 [Anaerolineales bacterium]|nr:hypothetical protein [Anaerolineales bacterium]
MSGYMLTVIDAGAVSANDHGYFRLKVWDINDGNRVVYDNEPVSQMATIPRHRLPRGASS